MLLARIKRKDRAESKKLFLFPKKDFSFGDVRYRIDPDCVYISQIWGFVNVRTIDFVQDIADPVNYYGLLSGYSIKKSKDTINAMVKAWFTNRILKLVDYILIGLAMAVGGSVVACIMLFMIGSKLGVF